ncbi:hypothetical protein ADUPG1_005930, partial [Aduncisulcus paluster]
MKKVACSLADEEAMEDTSCDNVAAIDTIYETSGKDSGCGC